MPERYRGCLLGLAACDALGTTVEFKPPGTFEPMTDIVGGGPFGLKPGQWTDDTSMALCLAESIVHCRGFDALDQMQRYVRWWKEGHMSPTGFCFDMGLTVSTALAKFLKTGDPYSGPTSERSAGNGSLMRLAPVPMAYANRLDDALRFSALSSMTTHGAKEAVDACKYYSLLIIGALGRTPKPDLLAPDYPPVLSLISTPDFSPAIKTVAEGSFRTSTPPEIRGSGYVVKSLEAALWAFAASDGFEQGALKAVNLGDDADTTGAVYGQLAGAFYGFSAIPQKWRDVVWGSDIILGLADSLFDLSEIL